MKHTKGEWKVIETELMPQLFVRTNKKIISRISFADFENDEEAEANAKLIAAAPDLLEAAMNLLSWKGGTPKHCKDDLEKAIKKATL